MYDVITVGSAVVDNFLHISRKFSEIKSGTKVLVKYMELHPGGGALITASALKTMGLKVKTLVKLGKDDYATYLLNLMRKSNIAVVKAKRSKYQTSTSFILSSDKESDRIIYTYKGATNDLSTRDFSFSDLNARWMLIGSMVERGFSTAIKIVQYAKKKGIGVLFNPSSFLARFGIKKLKPIISATTILVLNKEEAQLVLKEKSNSIINLAKELYSYGPRIVVITDGSHGIHAYDGSHLHSMKAYKVKVVSTVGAGDAFTSGFLTGIIEKDNLHHALELGMANATSVIQKFGAINGQLTYYQALKFIKRHRKPIEKVEG